MSRPATAPWSSMKVPAFVHFHGPLWKTSCTPQCADRAEGFKQCLFFGRARTGPEILKPQQYRPLGALNLEAGLRGVSLVNCLL